MYTSLRRYAVLLALPVLLAACNMSTPSQLRTGHIQLEESVATYSYPLADVTPAHIRAIAQDHGARGRGPVSVTASYLQSDAQARSAAQVRMRDVLKDMRGAGLASSKVDYVAVADARLAGQAIFAYPALTARAPDHCSRMPGYQGAEALDRAQSYQISCESKDLLARMIVRPADLLGNTGKGYGTSRRAGAVLESYQDGEPNELFYPPTAASDVGQ